MTPQYSVPADIFIKDYLTDFSELLPPVYVKEPYILDYKGLTVYTGTREEILDCLLATGDYYIDGWVRVRMYDMFMRDNTRVDKNTSDTINRYMDAIGKPLEVASIVENKTISKFRPVQAVALRTTNGCFISLSEISKSIAMFFQCASSDIYSFEEDDILVLYYNKLKITHLYPSGKFTYYHQDSKKIKIKSSFLVLHIDELATPSFYSTRDDDLTKFIQGVRHVSSNKDVSASNMRLQLSMLLNDLDHKDNDME